MAWKRNPNYRLSNTEVMAQAAPQLQGSWGTGMAPLMGPAMVQMRSQANMQQRVANAAPNSLMARWRPNNFRR